jgi:hypothetical protein
LCIRAQIYRNCESIPVTKLGEERVFDKAKMGERERERERESRTLIIEGASKPLSNVNQIAH